MNNHLEHMVKALEDGTLDFYEEKMKHQLHVFSVESVVTTERTSYCPPLICTTLFKQLERM